jgi:hypothetical protein
MKMGAFFYSSKSMPMAHLSSVVVSAEVRNIAVSCSSTAPQGTGSVVTSRSSAPCRQFWIEIVEIGSLCFNIF